MTGLMTVVQFQKFPKLISFNKVCSRIDHTDQIVFVFT